MMYKPRRIVIGLILLFFALLTVGSRALSVTADEFAYVAGGYALLAQGQAALPMLAQRGYAPLVPALEALFVYLGTPDLTVTALPGWTEAYTTFARAWFEALPNPTRTVFVSRLPVIWLSVLLAALVFRWGRDLVGPRAGLLALGMLLLDPTLLAHGRLATTDLPVTLVGTAALYAAWRWHRTGRWRWSFSAGMLLGATALAKLSGLLWAGCAAVIMLARFRSRRERRSGIEEIAQLVTVGILAYLIVWGAYGFAWGRVSALGVRLPAPGYWVSGFYLSSYQSPFFALGRYGQATWWWYFPVAFLIKNPLPLLLLWTGGGLAMVRRASHRRILALLAFFPVVYTTVAIAEGMNIGYRHMAPVHPFLHIAAGIGLAGGLRAAGRRGTLSISPAQLRLRRWIVGVLWAWYAIVTLRTHPNELAFFSTLIGGPGEGYHYLVDANLDWGQYGRFLDAYLADHPEVQVAPPSAPLRPASGRYLVGASGLQGVGIADPYTYAWFRHQTPTDQVNYGLLIYDVDPFPMTWVAQCGAPELPLDDDEIRDGTGRSNLRRVGFDCTRAWLYPGGATDPGLYILDRDLTHVPPSPPWNWLTRDPVADDRFVERRLAPLRLSYVHDNAHPPYVVYESEEPVRIPPVLDIFAAPADSQPRALPALRAEADATCGPCAMTGPLSFLGATLLEGETHLDVATWWRVTDISITRNFSLMAHLVRGDGSVVGIGDGLDVWPMTLVEGDVFVQRHRFARVDEAPDLWLRTGAYWLDTEELWSVKPAGDALWIPIAALRTTAR